MKGIGFINHLINIVIGIVQLILGFRIILKLFGAAETAPFVEWVYNTSNPLLHPFEGIFPSTVLDGTFVIEFSAIFAFLIYTLIGYFLTSLVTGFDRRWNNE
ncbi:YggT family protein [Alkalibacillus haloalkaliphilus]|uniref:YggT family protein n=1 Tax=Alkalibacillus haloalkaliphilus TaxID=94136 RepID=UPI00031E6BAA|nr:YggT family protein [Alkalibacillus haloalkaliphilus]